MFFNRLNRKKEQKNQSESANILKEISPRDNYILELAKPARTELDINRNSILLNAHFIEKEMAAYNTDEPFTRFLEPIAKSLQVLLKENPDYDKFAVLLATKLLLTYDKDDTLNIQTSIPEEYKEECQFIEVGRMKIPEPKDDQIFKDFLLTRHSFRRYKDELIDEETIKSVIKVGLSSPSACNRQPYRVIYATTKEGVELIRKVVPDQLVGRMVPNLLMIVLKQSMFNPGEELQGFVNGGIFLQNMLLSFHAHGLGATAFQTPIFVSQNREKLSDYNLADDEIILATIGFGIPEDKTIVTAAHRRRLEDVAKKL